ncbi:hypothetical protein [Nocardioides sp. GXQ0305]|uniref:hypothetical protein n=1 Tax=Nocardioides sp. GXQ0305 TaxID=3423912 RepID=UPI003D7EAB85
MELSPDELSAAARRWDALAVDLADAVASVRGGPVGGPGDVAGEVAQLREVLERTASGIEADLDTLVEGLLVTVRAVAAAEDAVVSGLARRDGPP